MNIIREGGMSKIQLVFRIVRFFFVLDYGMYHINNLKLKYPKVLLSYNIGSEKFRGRPKKVELVETVTEFFRNYRGGLLKRKGCGRYVVEN